MHSNEYPQRMRAIPCYSSYAKYFFLCFDRRIFYRRVPPEFSRRIPARLQTFISHSKAQNMRNVCRGWVGPFHAFQAKFVLRRQTYVPFELFHALRMKCFDTILKMPSCIFSTVFFSKSADWVAGIYGSYLNANFI